MLAQAVFGFFFDTAPHLEYYFQIFELSSYAVCAKAAFNTLRMLVNPAT